MFNMIGKYKINLAYDIAHLIDEDNIICGYRNEEPAIFVGPKIKDKVLVDLSKEENEMINLYIDRELTEDEFRLINTIKYYKEHSIDLYNGLRICQENNIDEDTRENSEVYCQFIIDGKTCALYKEEKSKGLIKE